MQSFNQMKNKEEYEPVVEASEVTDSAREELEGGDLVYDSLRRVRQSSKDNNKKWNDKTRFSAVGSKVKKDVIVQEEVKRQSIRNKVHGYLQGNTTAGLDHSPNARTLGVWIDQARAKVPKMRVSTAKKSLYDSPSRSQLVNYTKATLPGQSYPSAYMGSELPKKKIKKSPIKKSVDLSQPGARMTEVLRAGTGSLYASHLK